MGPYDTALWNTTERRVERPFLQVASLEQFTDEAKKSSIVDLLSQDVDQHVVREPVKKLAEVSFNEPPGPIPRAVHLAQGGVAPTSTPKTVGVVGKLGLVIRLQREADHLMHQLARPGRDA